MTMRPAVKYTPYDTPPREQTGNIITFEPSEEGGLLSETRNYAEKGDKSNDNSIIPPLLREE